MSRDLQQRVARVLMFGLSQENLQTEHRTLEHALQDIHKDWSLISGASETVEEAVRYVRKHDDLDVVQICHEFATNRKREQVIADATELARVLNEHPQKPWVQLSTELIYLEPVFKDAGLWVDFGRPDLVVFSRWFNRLEIAEGR